MPKGRSPGNKAGSFRKKNETARKLLYKQQSESKSRTNRETVVPPRTRDERRFDD